MNINARLGVYTPAFHPKAKLNVRDLAGLLAQPESNCLPVKTVA